MSAEWPGIEDWRKVVSGALKGRDIESLSSRTRDGIAIEPLYTRQQHARPIPVGILPWTIFQAVDDPDPDRAHQQAIADIDGGAKGLSLRLADSDSAPGPGLTRKSLAIVLEGVDLAKVDLRLEPNSDIFASAVQLSVIVERSGIAPELATISFGLDPLAFIGNFRDGPEPAQFAGTFSYLRSVHFRGPLACLDARIFHEAGATEAQELAAVLAAGAWWLRALAETNVGSPADVMQHFGAALSVDRDVLMSLAKLRALRLLWARLQELCGARHSPLPIHAETSQRMLTRADPHTNLLRNTLAAFAAAAGGADSILVQPHTAALGPADSHARALARNIQHLLMEESHLGFVADPAAGSGAIEALTDALAERAWTEFQQIEREGGILESLQGGAFQQRVAKARSALVKEVTSGNAPLVGSTLYAAGLAEESSATPVSGSGTLAPINLEALAKAEA